MNAPDLNEIYVMKPNEQKILCEENGHVCKFTFVKEDHTAGNILRVMLLRNPHVLFAGYRQPHPLNYIIEMTIRTDTTITPKQALEQAMDDVIHEIEIMQNEFESSSVGINSY
ncbi:DNA-directed RNA polymerase II subunit RPB11, putative [Entamoeba dispar SAW760]|uniref:DNA-directed RNA polymerase II subunit RPB11, putative n=1 Tax=Entamoeba dispar (strain ATCC PRA-260 / SAW760) TaxID=370354 RepID=B0E866_ENTDS|nr:DNA-directed RNA polymerase II subunit RPB11, putative [Entamoeba dispar SAW760]XP_001736882.1 DNA-directed RNA polymerase II subunit RPB11, putative [Entamoeba dispar SAW760]EDR26886.1 DNA-directed RNA polymerase II subunit RPB11, putative [Entamoeba dispar SAW760]EDR29278.1 DNA-directed RNA polymerase II subunit RPB11, putative [Entamoeba dispar SAW760]|eukprot:EDR26886.1 DNA-directed RNA polymerase II subunit RPB11, putative [Entamoeba dispar SAW760]